MEKFQIKTHLTYEEGKGIPKKGPHMTIEDQSMTVGQMLARMQNGIIPQGNGLQYPDNENDTQFIMKDLTDLDNAKITLDQFDRELKQKKADLEAALNQKAAEEAAKNA